MNGKHKNENPPSQAPDGNTVTDEELRDVLSVLKDVPHVTEPDRERAVARLKEAIEKSSQPKP